MKHTHCIMGGGRTYIETELDAAYCTFENIILNNKCRHNCLHIRMVLKVDY